MRLDLKTVYYFPGFKMAAQEMLFCTLVILMIFPIQSTDFCVAKDHEWENVRKLSKANYYFSVTFYKKLALESKGNFLFSPFSISSALGMLFYGAKGQAAQKFRQVLGYSRANLESDLVHSVFNRYVMDTLQKLDPDLYTLRTDSALLVSKTGHLDLDYREDLQKIYRTYIEEVDFADSEAVVEKVNKWITRQTNGNIRSMVESFDPSAAFLLLSIIYFMAEWRSAFEQEDTRHRTFYNNGLQSQPKEVPTMHMVETLRYGNEFRCQILELPYAGQNVSMLVLLPDRGHLETVERALSPRILHEFRSRLAYHRVILALPRFKLNFSLELSNILKALGISQIFESSDNHCGMSSLAGGRIEVRHKAVIDVREEGTKAAAVTGIVMTRMIPQSTVVPEFIVDRPFLFAIVENKSGMILFLGRMVQF